MRATCALVMMLAVVLTVAMPARAGGQPPASTVLRALLHDEDPAKVAFAAYHLAARGEAGVPAMRRLCTHADPYVRRAAVFALGTAPDVANAALVSNALRDRDPGVRRAAVFALANLGGAPSSRRLEGALNDPHPSVRELAATALGRLGGKRAAALLRGALDDPSLRVRRAAVVALGAGGDAKAVQRLRTLQRDPKRGTATRTAASTAKQLDAGGNFGYEFMTLSDLAARFAADTGIATFVTDEALMAVALAAEDPENLDGLKVSMWHVKTRTFLDELTRAAGLAWMIEGRWVVITPAAYAAYDTPIQLEIAGALYRLGDAGAAATLKRYAEQPRWKRRAEEILKSK